MLRKHYTYEQFYETFIKKPSPKGYAILDIGIEEDNDGIFHPCMLMDLVCEWRIIDGQIQFISVDYNSDEEYESLLAYVKLNQEQLMARLAKNRDDNRKYAAHVEK